MKIEIFAPTFFRLAVTTVLLHEVANAQGSPSPVAACVAGLPASPFKRVAVVIEASAEVTSANAILPSAYILTQSVAERIRAKLGGVEGTLSQGDSIVSWRRI